MSNTAEPKNISLPNWATDIFTEFLDKNERLIHVLRLSIAGIHIVRGRHQALEVLMKFDGRSEQENSASQLAEAQVDKDLAQREVDHDFPLLHEQATIALWSSLEALVRSFLAKWLAHTPEAWQTDVVKKLKVNIGEYESLEHSERCLWIVDLVDQQVSGPLRSGVTRFESLLQPFGLGGPVEESCQRALYELSQIRNALVHRSGVVDKRLADACPWLKLTPGQPLLVSNQMWRIYNDALGKYALELIQRVRVTFGLGRYVAPEKPEGSSQKHEASAHKPES